MNTAERIEQVLQYLSQRELKGKPIPASDQLEQRLKALTQGDIVPIPTFQCVDFEWAAGSQGEYPLAFARTDLKNPITAFFEDDLLDILAQLSQLGSPKLLIVVPDSELEDDRPFNFGQSPLERRRMAADYLQALPGRIPRICDAGGKVILWSQYCKDFGLQTPYQLTTQARQRIDNEPAFTPIMDRRVDDSVKYFGKKLGADYISGIPRKVMWDRVAWYSAMYMGEGIALLQSKAIPVNLEDMRVPAWFQRGADNRLPIITPVNPNRFFQARK